MPSSHHVCPSSRTNDFGSASEIVGRSSVPLCCRVAARAKRNAAIRARRGCHARSLGRAAVVGNTGPGPARARARGMLAGGARPISTRSYSCSPHRARRAPVAAASEGRPADGRRRDRARDRDRARGARLGDGRRLPVFLENFGLALLFFFAGLEVVEKKVPRRAVARGSGGWVISLALGLARRGRALNRRRRRRRGGCSGSRSRRRRSGRSCRSSRTRAAEDAARHARARDRRRGRVLADRRHLGLPHGHLRRRRGDRAALSSSARVVAGGAVVALRSRPPRIVSVLQETLHTTGQAAVRLALLLLAALVLLARDVGFDFVLGAFAAGSSRASRWTRPLARPCVCGSRGSGSGS